MPPHPTLREREISPGDLAMRKYPCFPEVMVVRVDPARWTLVWGAAVALFAAGCGGTALSKDDDSTGGGDVGATTCTLSHEGDLVVRTPAELDALRDHRLVSGDLIVDCPNCTTLTPLACLEEVGTMLSIVGCDQLESLEGLSALRRVGLGDDNGGLAIGFYFEPWETSGNARLRTLDGLGPVEFAEGRIHVQKNPELRDLSGLAGLTNIGASLYLVDNDSLPSLEDLSELWSVRGVLEITDNDALVDLTGLGSFSHARGLGIRGNDALVSLSGLNRFWGESSDLALDVADNPLLTDVTALKNVQGTIRQLGFSGNASLRAVSLNPALAILSSALIVRGNASLASFALPGLSHVGSLLQIEENPLLATLDLGAPASIGGLYLLENGALRDTAAFAEVRVVTNTVLIENNAVLERVTFPELQEVGSDVRINANPMLTGWELGSLRRAASVQVMYNGLLPSCVVADALSSVATTAPSLQCDNALDECANECPPRP
jgi:hypothetical protein